MLDNKHTTAKEWQEQKFLPWKRKMEAYTAQKEEQVAHMRKHAASFQAMVAMLIEGRTKQAALAWNTLELHPKLKEVRVSADGETLTLVAMDGTPEVLRLDDLLVQVQKLIG